MSESKVARAEALFNKYGAWAILVAAFTPIPYKVFTILAGIMDLPIRPFLLASLIGRGARFLTIGVLIYLFGEPIQDFIDEQFGLLTIAAAAGVGGCAGGLPGVQTGAVGFRATPLTRTLAHRYHLVHGFSS